MRLQLKEESEGGWQTRMGDENLALDYLIVTPATVSPANRAHHRTQSCHRTNQCEHRKTDHEKEPCTNILEEVMLHDASFISGTSRNQLCQPHAHVHGANGSCFLSHLPQHGQCLVHACRYCLIAF
ncbi:protein of unknown function [Nitrospira japonica]|uniref:Uncharacterized protein n=1 Tax=Nitrospira japonica TaxID=1325564 RepID=A0A1W1I3W1_9BACT|nr:protein of unknown function [Nitrospira japonica]